MTTEHMLVVDNNTESIGTILATVEDTNTTATIARTTEEGWNLFQQDSFTRVVVRVRSAAIDGLTLCRQLRTVASREELSIIVLLSEAELSLGAEALIAGATDLLLDPFERRELRMRAGIIPNDVQRRFDQAHTPAAQQTGTLSAPQMVIPEFDAASLRFGYGPYGHRLEQWQQDPTTHSMTLDRIIVCPKCEAIPTVRPGCGACGSAFVEQQVLIHHFACAHVGPADEFQTKDGLRCPKCHVSDLIAGSDFEQTKGCLTCADCDAIFTEPQMIGHCLSCQHRFNMKDGKLLDLTGYQTGPGHSAHIPSPNYMSDSAHRTVQRTGRHDG
ncbi:MAG: response regulator [Planctomycetaceae bacterium]|nr:response regulator [Planctomycetaceae bacterium]